MDINEDGRGCALEENTETRAIWIRIRQSGCSGELCPCLSPSIRRYLTSNATLWSASTPVRPRNLAKSFLAELSSINQNSDTNRVTDHVTSSDITERTEQSVRTEQIDEREQVEPANSTETSKPTDSLLKRLRQCKQTVTADKLARPSIKLTDAQTVICATQWKLS